MTKNSQNASPTPAAWTMRQQQPPESYQYSQLSPSRSPSGPTYTQLSSGINSRPAYPNATATTQQAPHQPGKFIEI
jgi:aryl hydrocarbon receptor nuclear translocator